MDSELSIDEIVTALHFSLEKTLKISLGPFVDKFNSSRNQFNVVSDLLKQLPEYKELITHNVMLTEENRILKEYIRRQNEVNNTNNRIKLEISEKDEGDDPVYVEKVKEEEEEVDEEEEVEEEEEEEEEEEKVEVVEVDDEDEEKVEVIEVDDEEEEEKVEVDDDEEEEVEVVEVDDEEEEVEVVEVDDEEEEEDEEEVEVVEVEEVEVVEVEEVDVEVEEDDDEISNNDVSQTPRSVVNTNEDAEDDTEDDDEEGLIEVVISGKDYFADNDEDGDIYEKISDDEPGDDPIGIFKDGVATFF